MDASGNPVIHETPAPAAGPSPLRRWIAQRLRVSAINARRWQNFKTNRRAYWSLWLFLGVFGLSLVSEIIANDKPILLRYKGEWLSPVLVNYPEEKFGGFLAVTDYKDPVILDEIKANGWMLWPLVRFSYSSINKDYPRLKNSAGLCLGFPAPPSWSTNEAYCEAPADQVQRYEALGNRNWLGTDDQGRDLFARLLYGIRISVLFGLLLTVLGGIVGVAAGAVQGFFGGWVDLAFQRFMEIWSSVPVLFLLIIISSVLVPGFWTLLGILLLFEWVGFVGVVRAEFLRARNLEYVTAARALGLSNATIMFKHILPNAMVATITFIPFKLTSAITSLTALDFLGLGLPPGSPSLGELLTQATSNLQAPWIAISAFVTLAGLLSMLIFIFEGVRDALDPRKTFQ
jgi:microcin C transport system permease protein